MMVKTKMAAKKLDGRQIMNCIINALNKYHVLHYQ